MSDLPPGASWGSPPDGYEFNPTTGALSKRADLSLTNDDIAQMIEDAHKYGYVAKGAQYTTITTDALTLVLRELLAARADRDAALSRMRDAEADMLKVAETARREARVAWVAERDAAVAEAAQRERGRAEVILFAARSDATDDVKLALGDAILAIRRGE